MTSTRLPSTGSPSSRSPRSITARTPDDLLAAVPVLMGFTPEESIAMLTIGACACFHARIDLPRNQADWDEVIDMLLDPVRDHQVTQVAFVFYAKERGAVRALAAEVVTRFRDCGVDVIDALHADGSRWYPALPGVGELSHGVPYDSATNPIALQAVVDGQVTFPSRSALAASLLGDPEALVSVESHLSRLPLLADHQAEAEATWARASLRRALRRGRSLGDDGCARLVRALTDVRVRDAAWAGMTRDNSNAHVWFWTDVVRRTPTRFLAAPAALLAFAAWLSGQGALAWCALDRCREGEQHYSMADLLARMLDGAVPPTDW